MKKTRNFFLLFIVLSSSGCIKTITQKQLSFIMNDKEKDALMSECTEINARGNIMQLLTEIKNETDEALLILESSDLMQRQSQIEEIANSINDKTKMVTYLAKPEWVAAHWNYEVNWLISKNDFNDTLGIHINDGFHLTSTNLKDIFFVGEKRNDLAEYVTIVLKDNKVGVHYKKTGSSLELCQLHHTLMILIEVKYRNIINKNKRFFNLTLNY